MFGGVMYTQKNKYESITPEETKIINELNRHKIKLNVYSKANNGFIKIKVPEYEWHVNTWRVGRL